MEFIELARALPYALDFEEPLRDLLATLLIYYGDHFNVVLGKELSHIYLMFLAGEPPQKFMFSAVPGMDISKKVIAYDAQVIHFLSYLVLGCSNAKSVQLLALDDERPFLQRRTLFFNFLL